MSLWKDAQKFMQNRPHVEQTEEILNLTDGTQVEQIVKELKMLYENATEREILRTVDLAREHLGNVPARKDFFLFARTKLED